MNKENLEKLVYRANLISIGIVSISVIAIFLYAVLFFYPTKVNEIVIKIDYPIAIDSTSIVNKINTNASLKYENSQKIDSLKNLKSYTLNLNIETKDLNNINKNNELIYKKIDSMLVNFQSNQKVILEEKKEREGFISFTSGILAIIIALSGFFGFKSINEMKLKAIESAEEEAKKFLRDKVSEIDEKYNDLIYKAVDNRIKTVKMLNNDDVESIVKSKTDELKIKIETLELKINKCCPENKLKKNSSTKIVNESTGEKDDYTTEKDNEIGGLFDNVDLTN